MNGAGAANPFAAVAELTARSWGASFDLFSAWAGGWQSLLRSRGVPAMQAMASRVGTPAPGGFASLARELQDILALPRLADLPALEPGRMPSIVPALELMAAAQQYLLAAPMVWLAACQRFQRQMRERGQEGGAGDAMDLWNDVVDQTLMEFNRSGDFARLQQHFLHAAMRYRLEFRKLGEVIALTLDLPARSQLDDVHRRLHDLLREVYALRRELRAGTHEPARFSGEGSV
jgi:hypothetical protein